MENYKAVETPLTSNHKLSKDDGALEAGCSNYRNIIGSLLYLTASRPDLMYPASLLSRFMQKPSQNHYLAAKRVLRYIKGTTDYGLKFDKNKSNELIGYCDSDWAGSPDNSKSTRGYCF